MLGAPVKRGGDGLVSYARATRPVPVRNRPVSPEGLAPLTDKGRPVIGEGGGGMATALGTRGRMACGVRAYRGVIVDGPSPKPFDRVRLDLLSCGEISEGRWASRPVTVGGLDLSERDCWTAEGAFPEMRELVP
jgi:hypothetical protein